MANVKRWSLSVLTGVLLVIPLVIAASFALAYRARIEAAGYLRVVMPLPIGATYDVVAAQLHNARLPVGLSGDCYSGCRLEFLAGDKWLCRLHLAPPVALLGRLDFRNGVLVYKDTMMGQDIMVWSASVTEGEYWGPFPSGVHGTADSSGNGRHIFVHLSPSDSSEYRRKAYAFNVACIGSVRSCKAVEYLPTVNDLWRPTSR